MCKGKENKKSSLISDIKSLDIFKEFYKDIENNIGNYNKKYYGLVFIYLAAFCYGIWSFKNSNIKCAVFMGIIVSAACIFLYKITKKLYKSQINSKHYERLKEILNSYGITTSESVSNLIDEAIFFKDTTLGLNETFKETMASSIGVVVSLMNIVLGAIIGEDVFENFLAYIIFLFIIYITSIPFIFLTVDFNKKSFSNIYNKKSSFDIYLAYLYKYKTELSIEESKKPKAPDVYAENKTPQDFEVEEDSTRETTKLETSEIEDLVTFNQIENKKVTITQTSGMESLIFVLTGLTIVGFAYASYKKTNTKKLNL